MALFLRAAACFEWSRSLLLLGYQLHLSTSTLWSLSKLQRLSSPILLLCPLLIQQLSRPLLPFCCTLNHRADPPVVVLLYSDGFLCRLSSTIPRGSSTSTAHVGCLAAVFFSALPHPPISATADHSACCNPIHFKSVRPHS